MKINKECYFEIDKKKMFLILLYKFTSKYCSIINYRCVNGNLKKIFLSPLF